MIKTHFIFCISWWLAPKSLLALSQKYETSICNRCQCFTADLLSYWIGYDIFAHLFFEEMVALLAMDVKTCLWSELENKQWPGEVCNKKYKNKVYCLWTFGTEGVVLYRNQLPVHFILHFAELQIGNSIKYKKTLFENNFLKCSNVKIILIPFNCFYEYI